MMFLFYSGAFLKMDTGLRQSKNLYRHSGGSGVILTFSHRSRGGAKLRLPCWARFYTANRFELLE
jgi:hypothetical protein